MPLVLVNRDVEFTQDQANKIFGPLYIGITVKWSLFSVVLVLGILSMSIFGVCCKKRRAIQREIVLD